MRINYHNIIKVALVALFKGCATPPTKSIENTKLLLETILESFELKTQAANSNTSDHGNSISTRNPSTDNKTSKVEKQDNSKLML